MYDYDINCEVPYLAVQRQENGEWQRIDIADFFDFIAPSHGAWNDPQNKQLIFEGPDNFRFYYGEDGPQYIGYPCRAESMTWEQFTHEFAGEMPDFINQYILSL